MSEYYAERFLLRIRLSVGDPAVRQMVATMTAAVAIIVCALVLKQGHVRADLTLGGGVWAWRACSFQFGLFAGLAVLATSTTDRRLRFLAMGVLAAVSACLQLLVRSGDLLDQLLCWTASSAGIIAGPALSEALSLVMRRLGETRRRKIMARDPVAAASEWFVQLHRTEPDQFDWASFDAWIRQSRAHREAYDRVEALWYEMDDHKAEIQRNNDQSTSKPSPSLWLFVQSAMAFVGAARSLDGGPALARFSIIALAWTLAAATG